MIIKQDNLEQARVNFLVFCAIIFTKGIFDVKPYTLSIYKSLMRVLNGDIKRLIINIPPRHGKTELVIILYTSWLFGLFPNSSFIHASYTRELACLNSKKIRDIIESDIYKAIFPNVELEIDSKAKHHWRTIQGGSFYASGAGGSITGFGAGGHVNKIFNGAVLIDDPHKVSEIYSKLSRDNVKTWFTETIQTRLNNKNTPIILIMQRLHVDDLTGFILKNDRLKEWNVLKIPLLNEEGQVLDSIKFSKEAVDDLKLNNINMFQSQYMQEPLKPGGSIFKESYWNFYDILPKKEDLSKVIITADTAQKTGLHNDWTVFQCWGLGVNGNLYLLDLFRNKLEAPDLRAAFKNFYDKMNVIYNLNSVYIEDASSGTGLIQDLKRIGIHVSNIKRYKDKLTRVFDIINFVSNGEIFLNKNASYIVDFISECSEFNELLNHKNDDQVDCLVDAVYILKRNVSCVKNFNEYGIRF